MTSSLFFPVLGYHSVSSWISAECKVSSYSQYISCQVQHSPFHITFHFVIAFLFACSFLLLILGEKAHFSYLFICQVCFSFHRLLIASSHCFFLTPWTSHYLWLYSIPVCKQVSLSMTTHWNYRRYLTRESVCQCRWYVFSIELTGKSKLC